MPLPFTVSTKAEEYGSFHNSSPPFHYYRNRFTCVHEHKRMLWDSLTVEVHPGRSHGCGISLLNSEVKKLHKLMVLISLTQHCKVNLPDNVDEAFCNKDLSILWSYRTVRNSFAVVINLHLCLHMLLTIIIITGP